uniref:Uncharacterized protein n=1 Tax=Glossina palpalis gambiensis TaxID=67801 RepID=A0A1B0AX95_9MUSC
MKMNELFEHEIDALLRDLKEQRCSYKPYVVLLFSRTALYIDALDETSNHSIEYPVYPYAMIKVAKNIPEHQTIQFINYVFFATFNTLSMVIYMFCHWQSDVSVMPPPTFSFSQNTIPNEKIFVREKE